MLKLLLNYGPYAITTAITLIFLYKDWKSFKKPFLRLTAISLILLLCIVGILNTFFTNIANEAAIKTANKNQEENTKQFFKEFDKLSQKIIDLKVDIKTSGLQQKADQLEAELKATQKAMISPKSTLKFTFKVPFSEEDPLVQKVVLPVKDDIVHLDFSIINQTEIPALNGELILTICDDCKFVTDPPRFHKTPGSVETQRNFTFERILQKTSVTFNADIKVPSYASKTDIYLNSRCVNCIVSEPRENRGIILLTR